MGSAGNPAQTYLPSDTFIAVMGSQFHQLQNNLLTHLSGTQDVTAYTFQHNGKTIHLIDTPGFDDTYRTDSDVLRDLAYYLASSYGNGYRLSGIIYLHPITHNRLTGTAFKNLRTFRKLCGTQSMSSTVLATTMWSGVTPEVGNARELELKETAEFWGDMIREGSTVYRHTDDHHSAINIISFLTDRDTKTVLELQAEMVDQKRSLEDTEAGREVDREMSKQREMFEKRLERTRQELEEAIAAKDDQHVKEIMQEQERFEAKLAAIQQGREELRISMEALISDKEKRHEEEMAKMTEQLTASQLEAKKQADEWQKYKEQSERQRKQDEVQKKKREEELEAAKQQAVDADLDKIRIALEAIQVIQLQVKEAEKREEEMLDIVAAEWSRKESQMKNALAEQAKLLERQCQMAYDMKTMEYLRHHQLQFLQQQQILAGMQQQMGNHNQQPPPYQEHPPCPQPSYGYYQVPHQSPYQNQTSYHNQAPPTQQGYGHESAAGGAAVGAGMGLATGAALTGAAMLGGCSII
ncbi:Reticulocyte-binding protein 2 a [Madurella mycetomatis]|uniref:Reticulocyte-binding protein 2 a n=1 Tax=Madurella mycetomatis TaxID=100816 RepID=A0A175WGM1_9PEZI|nr:Reticulocyte-binding protein 2 a [Madurella mycetomatis]